MGTLLRFGGLGLAFMLVACGGDDAHHEDEPVERGEPLAGGHVEAQLNGAPFEPTFGVALGNDDAFHSNGMSIVLSTGPINCDNTSARLQFSIDGTAPLHPPAGYYVFMNLRDREIGEHVCFDVFCVLVTDRTGMSDGSWVDAPTATTTITAIDQALVKGSIDFDFDGSNGPTHVNGDFEVKRCFP